MELPTNREADREGSESLRPQSEFLVSAQTASAQTPSWATCWRLVAKQKWKTLICIIAPPNYSKQKFLRATSTSDMTASVSASFRGLCASGLKINTHACTATHSDIRKPQSFSGCSVTVNLLILLPVSIFAFYLSHRAVLRVLYKWKESKTVVKPSVNADC